MTHRHDDDLAKAIIQTVPLPLLALDADLRVEATNEAFLRQFRVTAAETVGFRVHELGNGQWNIPELRRLLGQILQEKNSISDYRVEHQFEHIGRRVMHLNARRIKRVDRPDLILLIISDETEREALRAELVTRVEMADKLVDSVREGLLILDPDLRVRSASASFYDTFGVRPDKTEGRLIYDLGNRQWDIPELRRLLEDVLPRQSSFDDYEVTHTFEDIGERVMLLNGRRFDHQDLILLAIRDVTDVKENAARLMAVTQAANVGVFENDRRAGTVYWSPEMRDILGYPRKAPPPTADVVPEFVHPDDRAALAELFARAIDPEGDGAILHEHRIVRPDGEVRWVQMHGRVEFSKADGERKPVLVRGVLLDITERKSAEEALRERERRLQNVLDGMGEAFGLLDHDLRIITQNEAALKLDGRPLAEIRGRPHQEVYPGTEGGEIERLYRHALAEQVPVALEHRFRFPDGRPAWLDMRAYPVPEGLAVFWRDITERKQAEATLRESEERYRTLFNSMDEAYAVVEVIRDASGRYSDFLFVEVNPAFMKHTSMPFPVGKTATELLGTPNPRWAEIYGQVVDTGQAVRIEEVEPVLDRIFDLNIFRLGDAGSRRVAVLFSDVTQRKRAEERQDMLVAELDHRVKNILAVVQAIARQTLGKGEHGGGDGASRLIGRINALAQSHALLARSRWEGARFADIVESTLGPYREGRSDRIFATGAELKVSPKAAQTLSLALHELATNAAKYGALSREGGSVTAEWRLVGERDSPHLFFTWQEQGGPAIEEPPVRKGFGSLLIEKMMASELHGDVRLDYAREGLRAVFDLPAANLRPSAGPGRGGAKPDDSPTRADPARLRGRSVLVVEDEYLIGEETTEALRMAGCNVTGPVATLAEALQIAVRDDLDAAILDINLNGEQVWPAARALKARGIPFLFASGYSQAIKMPTDLDRTPRVEKPVAGERLVSTLAALVCGG